LLSMTSFTPFLSSKTDAPKLSSTIIQNNNKKILDGSQNFYCSFLLFVKAQSGWKL
jgi:hypothetical protein